MNETQPAAPSLLSLTAPKTRSSQTERAEGDRFTSELSQAVESKDSKPEQKRPVKESPVKASKESSEAPPESIEPEQADPETAAVDETQDGDELAEVLEPDAEVAGPVEEGLLAVVVASETIVLETSPDAQLPEEAATSIDVDANLPGEITQAEQSGDSAVPTPTGVVEAASLEAGGVGANSSTVTKSEAEAGAEGEAKPTTEPVLEAIESVAETLEVAADANSGNDDVESTNPTAASVVEEVVQATLEGDSTTQTVGVVENETNESSDSSQPSAVDLQEAATEADESETAVVPPPAVGEASSDSADLGDQPKGPDGAASSGRETNTAVRDTAADRQGDRIEAAGEAADETRPKIDPSRFVSRVTRAIDSAHQRGGGPIEMRLSPPELGSMQVKIEVKEGVMTATLDVETPAARNALLDNLPSLRDRLEQQQIRIEKFDVDVRDDSQQRGGDWQQREDAQQQRPDGRESRREPAPSRPGAPATRETGVVPPAVQTIVFDDNGINLVA